MICSNVKYRESCQLLSNPINTYNSSLNPCANVNQCTSANQNTCDFIYDNIFSNLNPKAKSFLPSKNKLSNKHLDERQTLGRGYIPTQLNLIVQDFVPYKGMLYFSGNVVSDNVTGGLNPMARTFEPHGNSNCNLNGTYISKPCKNPMMLNHETTFFIPGRKKNQQ